MALYCTYFTWSIVLHKYNGILVHLKVLLVPQFSAKKNTSHCTYSVCMRVFACAVHGLGMGNTRCLNGNHAVLEWTACTIGMDSMHYWNGQHALLEWAASGQHAWAARRVCESNVGKQKDSLGRKTYYLYQPKRSTCFQIIRNYRYMLRDLSMILLPVKN
jgi:hypothetical protein